jgi:dCTP diphosphatase
MATDKRTTLESLKSAVRRFSQERDWEPFHHPKDLGIALACEVGELLDHVRYRTPEQVAAHLSDPRVRREFAHELADCLWVLLRLADVTGIDLSDALHEKLALADAKYPVDQARGRPDKYTAYRSPTAEQAAGRSSASSGGSHGGDDGGGGKSPLGFAEKPKPPTAARDGENASGG